MWVTHIIMLYQNHLQLQLTSQISLFTEVLDSPELHRIEIIICLLRCQPQSLCTSEQPVRCGVDDGELQEVQRSP